MSIKPPLKPGFRVENPFEQEVLHDGREKLVRGESPTPEFINFKTSDALQRYRRWVTKAVGEQLYAPSHSEIVVDKLVKESLEGFKTETRGSVLPTEGSISFVTTNKEREAAVVEAENAIGAKAEIPEVFIRAFDGKADLAGRLASQVKERSPFDLGFVNKIGEKTISGVAKTVGFLEGFLKKALNPKAKEAPMTEDQLKKKEEQKKKNGRIQQFYNGVLDGAAKVGSLIQESLIKLQQRLGLGGMSSQEIHGLRGKGANTSRAEVSESDIREAGTAYAEAQERDKKQELAVNSQAVNANADKVMLEATEGGTAGGKANISAQNASG